MKSVKIDKIVLIPEEDNGGCGGNKRDGGRGERSDKCSLVGQDSSLEVGEGTRERIQKLVYMTLAVLAAIVIVITAVMICKPTHGIITVNLCA